MIAFIRQLWVFVRPYRVRFFLGVLTGIISGLLEPLMIATIIFVFAVVFPEVNGATLGKFGSAMPKFMQVWVQQVHETMNNGIPHPTAKFAMIALIPTIVLLRGIFGYLNIYLFQWTAVRTVTDVRTKLFAHLMNLSTGFFTKNPSGELISRIVNDTSSLQGILNNTVSVIIKDPATIIGTVIWLLWYDWKLTLMAMVVLPFGMLPVVIFGRKGRKSSRGIQNESADLMKVMTEAFNGQRVIKAYNLEATVAGQFQKNSRVFISHYMRIVRAMELPGPLMEFFGSFGVTAIFLYLLADKHGTRDFGSLLTYIVAIFTMYRPLKNVTRLHNQLHQARAATERVFQLLATENSVPEPAAPKMLHADNADIVIENLDFNYGPNRDGSPGQPVLQNVSLTIKAGQVVALVGGTGSGKTTLANLLMRFYDPVRGSIKIGGVDLREVSTRDLRNQIAVVTQENILFDDTIRRNIELGRLGATFPDIKAAADFAKATNFINEKKGGFDEIIGEKGVQLSGGQKQRLAIARAVLRDAPILILDEATSALDIETERQVQKELDTLMKGRTSICIAHRLSTIIHADVIVVFEKGRIVEQGTHAELSKRGGVYQNLYDKSVSTSRDDL